jgi:hypothetical protein
MHYLHHAKFDCNFGSSIFPLDALFGTHASFHAPAIASTPCYINLRSRHLIYNELRLGTYRAE